MRLKVKSRFIFYMYTRSLLGLFDVTRWSRTLHGTQPHRATGHVLRHSGTSQLITCLATLPSNDLTALMTWRLHRILLFPVICRGRNYIIGLIWIRHDRLSNVCT